MTKNISDEKKLAVISRGTGLSKSTVTQAFSDGDEERLTEIFQTVRGSAIRCTLATVFTAVSAGLTALYASLQNFPDKPAAACLFTGATAGYILWTGAERTNLNTAKDEVLAHTQINADKKQEQPAPALA